MMTLEQAKRTIIIFIIIYVILIIYVVFLKISINDQNNYINGLRSQKAICDGQLEMVKQDYRRLFDEFEKRKGEIDD